MKEAINYALVAVMDFSRPKWNHSLQTYEKFAQTGDKYSRRHISKVVCWENFLNGMEGEKYNRQHTSQAVWCYKLT